MELNFEIADMESVVEFVYDEFDLLIYVLPVLDFLIM
jgi:hypothetical protein